jgi:predicted negative regulator of RcsB-dependent stress response
VLQKAVEDKNAQHIEIYDHLGDVLVALGETEAALTAWRKGIENVGESRRDQQIKKNVQQKIEKHSGK